MSNRFALVQYDRHAIEQQAKLKEKFEVIESLINELADGRAKSLTYTYLEMAFSWAEKAVSENQMERTKK